MHRASSRHEPCDDTQREASASIPRSRNVAAATTELQDGHDRTTAVYRTRSPRPWSSEHAHATCDSSCEHDRARVLFACGVAQAHGIAGDDQAFLLRATGAHIGPYVYLGAKHMVTGYDHLLFLAGVIFFLYRLKDVALYVTLFAVGHSTTLLLGVLAGWHVDSYLVDAVIGLSVVYKAFENLGGFRRLGFQPNTKAAVLFFGFFHGLGLATKLQDSRYRTTGSSRTWSRSTSASKSASCSRSALMLIAFNLWRRSGAFVRHAFAGNVALMAAGFVLAGFQLTGFLRRVDGRVRVGEWRRLGAAASLKYRERGRASG